MLGYLVAYVPPVEQAATSALSSVFPGMIGSGPGQINVQAIARRRADVGIVGLLVLLYSGLGWVSAMRAGLQAVFEVQSEKKPNFVVGKAYDLLVLVVVGIVLLGSVGLGTAVTAFTGAVVRVLGLSEIPGAHLVVVAASIIVGIRANTLVFFAMYRLLPKHHVPNRAVWLGSLLAGVAFEVLKLAAGLVIGTVTGNPLYGAFAIMVALLVWINYFDRLAILGAAWVAVTGLRPSDQQDDEAGGNDARGNDARGNEAGGNGEEGRTDSPRTAGSARPALAGALAALAGVGVVAWLRTRRRRRSDSTDPG